MDRNTLLAFALSMLAIWMWVAWQEQRREPGRRGPAAREAVERVPAPSEVAGEEVRGGDHRRPDTEGAVEIAPEEVGAEEAFAEGADREWEVETPLYRAVLTARGAGIQTWELKTYHLSEGPGSPGLRVIDRPRGARPALVSTLPRLVRGGGRRMGLYDLVDREGDRLRFESQLGGVTIRKTYRFYSDNYRADLAVEVINGSEQAIDSGLQVEIPARVRPGSDFANAEFAVLHGEQVEWEWVGTIGKASFLGSLVGSRPELPIYRGDIGWLALSHRYFVVAIAPGIERTAQVRLSNPASSADELGVVAYPGRGTISPGLALRRDFSIYAGPKEAERLQAFGSDLERTIYLGWFWVDPIARGFNWLLAASYRFIPNYGVAIILLTLLLRVVLTPLTIRQMVSMKANAAKMSALQPKIKEIQARYAEDAQRRNEATMALYREEGVNPLAMFSGCFPMLLQLPVFIGLYYALQASISLRHAPFALWIDDLSSPETLFLIPGVEIPIRALPLLMGASMILQQKLTPTPSVDPNQARMMLIAMPILFTALLYGFPSGLVLYWFVSNLLGIAQQVWINRRA